MVLEKFQVYVTHLCQKYAALIMCHLMTVVRVCVRTVGTCGKVGVAVLV